MRGWRNRQTRWIQVPVPERAWGSTPPRAPAESPAGLGPAGLSLVPDMDSGTDWSRPWLLTVCEEHLRVAGPSGATDEPRACCSSRGNGVRAPSLRRRAAHRRHQYAGRSRCGRGWGVRRAGDPAAGRMHGLSAAAIEIAGLRLPADRAGRRDELGQSRRRTGPDRCGAALCLVKEGAETGAGTDRGPRARSARVVFHVKHDGRPDAADGRGCMPEGQGRWADRVPAKAGEGFSTGGRLSTRAAAVRSPGCTVCTS